MLRNRQGPADTLPPGACQGRSRRRTVMRCSTCSSRPNRPAETGTSRALCQSTTKTSWSASIAETVPRTSVAKCPASPGTTSTFGLGCRTAVGFDEVDQRSERGRATTTSSFTAISTSLDATVRTPRPGRSWVSRSDHLSCSLGGADRVALHDWSRCRGHGSHRGVDRPPKSLNRRAPEFVGLVKHEISFGGWDSAHGAVNVSVEQGPTAAPESCPGVGARACVSEEDRGSPQTLSALRP